MISYKDAGVDIEAGNSFVNEIKPYTKQTLTPLVLGGIGSFSGAIKLPSGYKNPAILGATDGVGTKLRLAIDHNKLDGVGEDLVAMCVNDLICNFATPLFFLDYYATAKLDIASAKRVISGIASGCIKAECALIGGETAEMPSMYNKNDFDLAGFAVGIAEVEEIDRTKYVKNGDIAIALPSSGIHSNGYSLVRKVIKDRKLNLNEKIDDKTILDTILEPTRIYVKTFLSIKDKLNALAHITGGGILENIPRILPSGLGVKIEQKSIKTPPIFDIFKGLVEKEELYRTFNMGVGMVLIASKENADHILSKTDGYVIGEIINGNGVSLS